MKKITLLLIMILAMIFTGCDEASNKTEVKLSAETKKILNEIGPDDRVDDFLKVHQILGDFDSDTYEVSDAEIELLNEIASKWDLEEYTKHINKSMNIMVYFNGLILPAYYENANYQKNILEVNKKELEDTIINSGFQYNNNIIDSDSEYINKMQYFKNGALKGPFCQMNTLRKDNSVEYVNIELVDTRANFESDYENHIKLDKEQQRKSLSKSFVIALKNSNIKNNSMLNILFSSEDLNKLDIFIRNLDEQKINENDIFNILENDSILAMMISANLGNKNIGLSYSLGDSLNIIIKHKDSNTSEFETNLNILRKELMDIEFPISDNSEVLIIE